MSSSSSSTEEPDLTSAPFTEEQRQWLSQLTEWARRPQQSLPSEDSTVKEPGASASDESRPSKAGECTSLASLGSAIAVLVNFTHTPKIYTYR